MESLIEQVVLQFPVVAILVYIMQKQEARMDDLMADIRNCLNSQKKDD